MKKFVSSIWFDLFLILAVGAFSICTRYEGWRGKELLNIDMVPYYLGVQDFLSTGKIIEKGELASYHSYNPPGTFYFMIPGVLLVSDPRLQDLPGTILIVFATLVFLYLAVREAAGRAPALAAGLVYGASRVGFMGLWPIGHPLFLVASLYFLLLWVKRRAGWALAVNLALLALGLYMDLAIIPIVLIIPVVWLIYRPPLAWKSLLAALVFGCAVWFPYLRYETGRGFADLASLLLLRDVDSVWEPSHKDPVYCYSTGPGENDVPEGFYLPYVGGPEIEARVVYPLEGVKNQIAYRSCRLMMNIDRNFDGDLLLTGTDRVLGSILWAFFMTAWMTFAWVVARSWKPVRRLIQIVAEQKRWIPLVAGAGGAVILYLLASPAIAEKFSADQSIDRNVLLSVVQIRAYLPWIWVSFCLGLFFSKDVGDRNPDNVILFTVFSLPWTILLILGEPGRPERFWYMWPMQVVVMILFLYWMSERLRRGHLVFWILTALLGLALLPLPFIREHLSNIRDNGFAGSDNNQWKVMEFLAEQASFAPDKILGVEYWLAAWATPVDPLDQGYQIRDWFDYLLLSQYGIRNAGPGCRFSSGCETWGVVDQEAGIPAALQGLTPEAVFGNYAVYRLP
jgi:hypothetical protein